MTFLHGHKTERAALLLHGLTASPTQWIDVANALFALGWNVVVARLPGHGYADRLTDALVGMTSEDLMSRSDEALDAVRDLGERITVVGFSVGGMLALRLAQQNALDSVVAIAPFFGWAWLPLAVQPLAMRALLAVPNAHLWWDMRLRERLMPAHGYPRVATHAVAHAFSVGKRVRDDAMRIVPRAERIVAVLNEHEGAVHNGAARGLIDAWRSRGGNARIHMLKGLPLSHDIIEPLAQPALSRRVFADIMEIITE
ncbi:MAG: alpha/beta hydrolase [Vulcanimicrobiaceae bacterium]